MTQANRLMESSLLCILQQDETLLCAGAGEEINQLMQQHPDATLIYNQNPHSLQAKDSIEYSDGQQTIEIFQDTEGVFGLRAYQLKGKMQTPVTLELSDDE